MDKTEIEVYGVKVRSVEVTHGLCHDCVFYSEFRGCSPSNEIQPCTKANRLDGKDVIWVLA